MDEEIIDEFDGGHAPVPARSEPRGHDCDGKTVVVGDRVEARYKGKGAKFYPGQISAIVPNRDGSVTFNIGYDDGDREEGALPNNVRRVGASTSERVRDEESRRHGGNRTSPAPRERVSGSVPVPSPMRLYASAPSSDEIAEDDDERSPQRSARDIRPHVPLWRQDGAPSAQSGGAPRPSTASVQRSVGPSTGRPPPSSPPRRSFPVSIPTAALAPPSATASAPGSAAARNRDTVIVRRTVPPPPPASSAAPQIISAAPGTGSPPRIPGEGGVWHEAHMEELTHGRQAKEAAARRRAAEAEAAAAAAEKARKLYMRGGFKGESPLQGMLGNSDRATGAGSTFLERQDAAARSARTKREDGALAVEYAARVDKKHCSECGTVQSFEEWKGGVKRCPRDGCRGALYRPKKVWSDFQHSFLQRWREDIEGAAKRKEDLIKEAAPPFRLTTQKVFNKATGTLDEVPVPPAAWDADVAEGFFARQEAFDERRADVEKRAEEERTKPLGFSFKPETNSRFRFTAALPDFHERQRLFAERKLRPFEEKLQDYLDKYHPDDPGASGAAE